MTDADIETVRHVVEDLRAIEAGSVSGVEEHQLRHITVLLRAMADEGSLIRAWKLAGFASQPTIHFAFLSEADLRDARLAIAAGAMDYDPARFYGVIENATTEQIALAAGTGFNSGPVLLAARSNGEMAIVGQKTGFTHRIFGNTVSAPDDLLDVNRMQMRDLPISTFFESTAIFYEGKRISRHSVIQFIAYVRSGVHWGRKMRPKEKEAEEVLRQFSREKMEYRDLVYYVFQSIAQDIVKASDVRRLMNWTPPPSQGS